MLTKDTWLTHFEEQVIKAQFKQYMEHPQFIPSDITPILKRLNSIDGLVTLTSNQISISNPYNYISLRTSTELIYFLEESIWYAKEKHQDMEIFWDEIVLYNLLGKPKTLSCIILKSDTSYEFMETIAKFLDV
jgi:hypothetical protein